MLPAHARSYRARAEKRVLRVAHTTCRVRSPVPSRNASFSSRREHGAVASMGGRASQSWAWAHCWIEGDRRALRGRARAVVGTSHRPTTRLYCVTTRGLALNELTWALSGRAPTRADVPFSAHKEEWNDRSGAYVSDRIVQVRYDDQDGTERY